MGIVPPGLLVRTPILAGELDSIAPGQILGQTNGAPEVVVAIPCSLTNIECEGIDCGAVTPVAMEEASNAAFLGVGAAECREKVIIRAHTGES